MVDAKRYLRLKEQGVTNVVKTSTGFSLTFKRFNVENGAELELPEIQAFDVKDLHMRKLEIQEELDGLNLILSECEKLK